MPKINDYIAHRLLFFLWPPVYRKFWKNKLGVTMPNLMPSAKKIEKEIALLPIFLDKDTVFFDVGSNMGLYLFWANELGVKNATGFEPIPFLHKKLARIFPAYQVENLAISSSKGNVVLRIPKVDQKLQETRATLLTKEETSEFDECVEINIPSISLDEYCAQRGLYPDFIKVDIEGAEGHLLKGCTDLLKNKRPILMVEIEQRHNVNMDGTINQVTQYGYGCYHFSPQTLCIVEYASVDGLQDAKNERTPAYINNFIFIPEEKKEIVEKIKKVHIS